MAFKRPFMHFVRDLKKIGPQCTHYTIRHMNKSYHNMLCDEFECFVIETNYEI